MFDSLLKAAVAVVRLPVAVAADVVTMGGALTDTKRPYTVEAASDIQRNLENATRPNK